MASTKAPSGPESGNTSVALEAITNVADGLDQARTMRVGFDLCAKGRDASIHTAVVDHDVIAPDGIENLVPGEGAAGPLGEKFQQPELLGSERHYFPFAEELMRGEIQLPVSALKLVG